MVAAPGLTRGEERAFHLLLVALARTFQRQRELETKPRKKKKGAQSPGLQTEYATVGPDLPFQVSGSQGTRGLCSAWVPGVRKFFIASILWSCPASVLSWGKRMHPGTQACGAPRAVRGQRRETCLQLQP